MIGTQAEAEPDGSSRTVAKMNPASLLGAPGGSGYILEESEGRRESRLWVRTSSDLAPFTCPPPHSFSWPQSL